MSSLVKSKSRKQYQHKRECLLTIDRYNLFCFLPLTKERALGIVKWQGKLNEHPSQRGAVKAEIESFDSDPSNLFVSTSVGIVTERESSFSITPVILLFCVALFNTIEEVFYMQGIRFKVAVEGTIFAALAIVLSLVPTNIGPSITVSLGTIPLTLFALRRGTKAAIFSGFLWGILHFLIGNAYILSFVQGFIEYFIAFAFIGFAGLFSNKLQSAIKNGKQKDLYLIVCLSAFTGTFARFFWHFWAGYVYWGSYAPEGMGAFLYSFLTNGASGLMTAIVASIVLVLLIKSSKRLFVP